MSQRTKRWAFVGVALLLAVGAVAARVLLYTSGTVFNPHGIALLTLAAVAIVTAALLAVYWAWRANRSPSPTQPRPAHTDVVTIVGGVIALATALYALTQLVFPTTPQQAAADACRGVPLYGARAFGQTGSVNVNARSGAGSAFPPQDRFGTNCTLGFDGFCLGEPIGYKQAVTNLPDQRWFIIHDRNEVVSGDYISLQSPQSALGTRPSKRCGEFHGVVGPHDFSWTAHDAGPEVVKLSADAPGALIVGFAVEYTQPQAAGGFRFVSVADYSPVPRFVSKTDYALWSLQDTPPVYKGTASLVVAGTPCYADDAAPPGLAKFKKLTFTNGHVSGAADIAPPPDAAQLVREACSIV